MGNGEGIGGIGLDGRGVRWPNVRGVPLPPCRVMRAVAAHVLLCAWLSTAYPQAWVVHSFIHRPGVIHKLIHRCPFCRISKFLNSDIQGMTFGVAVPVTRTRYPREVEICSITVW